MGKGLKVLGIIIVLVFGIYMIWNGISKIKGAGQNTTPTTKETATVTLDGGFENCGTLDKPLDNPRCFINNFMACTKAKLEMQGNDGSLISMTIFGMENEKCHYQMDVKGHGVNCFFNKSDLDEKLINQVFGNDEGKKSIVDEACKMY